MKSLARAGIAGIRAEAGVGRDEGRDGVYTSRGTAGIAKLQGQQIVEIKALLCYLQYVQVIVSSISCFSLGALFNLADIRILVHK